MNQIESILGFLTGCDLRLWSDATHQVDTEGIKHLARLVAEQLDLELLRIDAYYYQEWRNWVIVFRWHTPDEQLIGVDYRIDASHLERYRKRGQLTSVASDAIARIRRTIPIDSQNWVIVRWREGFLAGIHQAGKRSVSLILREVTQDRDFATNHAKVTIEAWIPGNAIPRGDGVEVDGMLLQGELLEWLEIGEERRFRFSPNTHQVNVSASSLDETRITFTTRPRTNRLASFERMRQMLELGQIEIPRSGYFDRILMDYPGYPRDRDRIEIPRQRMPSTEISFTEPSGVPLQEIMSPIPNTINAIGDVSCEYNAKSKYLRCTVNPCGPCEGCQHYEKI